ncbi:MAG: flagellar protein FlgN [Sinobacteraceae bacterium]|nr:flagellar protein FlgN [Nevskiaceae bacterium]MBV9914263.1 flagellar protein FlgN [Nevskiaceae bacterium]
MHSQAHSADAQLCHDSLATLLAQESRMLADLQDLLQREGEVLATNQVAAVERIAPVRQQMMGALARTEEQRRTLCTLHGYSPDWIGLEQLLQWCDPSGSLLPSLRDCAQRAMRCRDLNSRNGELVSFHLKHVEARLAALARDTLKPVTYGPKGAEPLLHPKRELGAA